MGIFDSGLFGVVGSLFGGGGGADDASQIAQQGADKATDIYNASADKSNALLGGLWGQQQGWLNPYMQAGTSGLTAYQNYLNGDQTGLDAYKASTGYKTNLQAGTDALSSQAGSRGLLHSGGAAKALEKYGVGLNQQYGQNYLNNLMQQIGVGQGAVSTGVGAAAHYGDAVSGNNNIASSGSAAAQMAAATAAANGKLAQGSSFNNALGQFAQILPFLL